MHTKKRKLMFNTFSAFAFRVITIICGFILPRLILKAYGSEVNGLITSITQFLGVISFLELGVGAVIQSSLYKPLAEKNKNEISQVLVSGRKFFRKLSLILLCYIFILFFIYPVIANQDFGYIYTASMIVIISISSFAQYYFGIINSLLLSADQKGYITYNIQIVTLLLNTFACVIFIKLGAGIHIVKLATSVIYALRPLALYVYVNKHYEINWKVLYDKEPIKQKWNGVSQHIAAVVLDGTDSIVLTIFESLKAVSIYSVYNIVVVGIKDLLLSMTNGIQSLFGELWAKKEIDKLYDFFGYVEWVIHTVTILAFGITSVLIVPFVMVYTEGISDINYIQPVFAFLLVLANAGHCLRLPYNIMILAAGHYKQTQHNYIIASTLNIVLSIIAVNRYGLVGVVIGTVVAMFYQTFWMAWYNSKNLVEWPMKRFFKQVFVDAVIILAIQLVGKIPIFESFLRMNQISYISWIVLAIKLSIICVIISILVNIVFYKKNLHILMSEIKSIKK